MFMALNYTCDISSSQISSWHCELFKMAKYDVVQQDPKTTV